MSADIIDHPKRRPTAEPRPEKSTARFWMKHDVRAFAFETSTVDTEAAGALMFVRGHYFINGCLPKTDKECAKVCRLSVRKFARIREWLFSFFDDAGRSPELDASIEEAERISAQRREAGRKGGEGKALAFARCLPEQSPTQSQSQSQLEKEKPSSSLSEKPSPAPNPEPRAREATEIAAECLAVMPISMKADPRMRGFTAWIERLHAEGVDKAAIIEGVTRSVPSLDGPPATFEYFRPAINRAAASHRGARPVSSGAEETVVSLQTFIAYIECEIGCRPGTLTATVDRSLLYDLHDRFTAKAIGISDAMATVRAALSQGGAV